MTFKDKTFCASPNCQNKCGRQMTPREKAQAVLSGATTSYALFCDSSDSNADDVGDTDEQV